MERDEINKEVEKEVTPDMIADGLEVYREWKGSDDYREDELMRRIFAAMHLAQTIGTFDSVEEMFKALKQRTGGVAEDKAAPVTGEDVGSTPTAAHQSLQRYSLEVSGGVLVSVTDEQGPWVRYNDLSGCAQGDAI